MTALGRMVAKSSGVIAASLALVFASPAIGQTDAPVDVTAAPPPSAETVGPSQLRNFSLQGTVTRPSERPTTAGSAPATTATAPAGRDEAVPSVAAAGPGPARIEPVTTSPVSRTSATGTSDFSATPSTSARAEPVTPSLPLEVTTGAAPQPGLDGTDPTAPAGLAAADGMMSWSWLLALAALFGGGIFIFWSRRRRELHDDPGRLAFAGPVPDAVAGPAARPIPGPRPDPVPPKAPGPNPPPPPPMPSNDGLIVSRAFKPELSVQFVPDRVVVNASEVVLQFDIVITNSGSAPARDVLVEARLFTAHPNQDREIAGFFENPVGAGDRIPSIAPFGKLSLKSAVRMPIDQVHSFEVEGRRLFVPLVGFNMLFRSSGGDGKAAASYMVGRGDEQADKLAPFRIDLGPRIFRGLAARAHSMGLQVA